MNACLPPAGRREQRKADRRQAIVEAARGSFLERGYAGTSMSGLLTQLGGSKATLWGYFRSKEELFAAVIDDVSRSFRAELGDVLSSGTDLPATLRAFCRTFVTTISTPEAIATWRMVVAESGRFPELGHIFYQHAAAHTRSILSAYLSHRIAEGLLAVGDPDCMADTLIDLCAGQQTRRLWGAADLSENFDDAAAEYARIFLSAYARGAVAG